MPPLCIGFCSHFGQPSPTSYSIPLAQPRVLNHWVLKYALSSGQPHCGLCVLSALLCLPIYTCGTTALFNATVLCICLNILKCYQCNSSVLHNKLPNLFNSTKYLHPLIGTESTAKDSIGIQKKKIQHKAFISSRQWPIVKRYYWDNKSIPPAVTAILHLFACY